MSTFSESSGSFQSFSAFLSSEAAEQHKAKEHTGDGKGHHAEDTWRVQILPMGEEAQCQQNGHKHDCGQQALQQRPVPVFFRRCRTGCHGAEKADARTHITDYLRARIAPT